MRGVRSISVVAALCAFAVVGMTATSTVAGSRAGGSTLVATVSELAPAECAGLLLSRVVTGSGAVRGSAAGDLILGSPRADRMRGRGGSDCIVGGDGNDRLSGNSGADVCIGGPGVDRFSSCAFAYQ